MKNDEDHRMPKQTEETPTEVNGAMNIRLGSVAFAASGSITPEEQPLVGVKNGESPNVNEVPITQATSQASSLNLPPAPTGFSLELVSDTELASDPNDEVRRSVVANPDTPAKLLTLLARDHDPIVRMGVAKHPNTPTHVLTLLATDPEADVRRSVAPAHTSTV